MALSDSALTTFANVQTFAAGKIPIASGNPPGGQQPQVEAMINGVSRAIASKCHRIFPQQAYLLEPCFGTMTPRLRLRHRPILSVQSVQRVASASVLADLIPATDYEVHTQEGYLYRNDGWGPSIYPVRRSMAGNVPHSLAVSYTAGYVVPGMYGTAPAITAATPGTGGSLAPGTWYYAVTPVWSNGIESVPSAQAIATVAAPNNQVALAWSSAVVPAAPAGLTILGYRVYRSPVPLSPAGYVFDQWTWPATGPTWYAAAASPFTDVGAAGSMGIPPLGVPEDLELAAIESALHVFLMRDKTGRTSERTSDGLQINYDWIPPHIEGRLKEYRSLAWRREQ